MTWPKRSSPRCPEASLQLFLPILERPFPLFLRHLELIEPLDHLPIKCNTVDRLYSFSFDRKSQRITK